jgi:hypothetical protein
MDQSVPRHEARAPGPGVFKLKFTQAEDTRLIQLVNIHGSRNWGEVARHMPHRTNRQCRERWSNYLNPELQTTPWTDTEDARLLARYREFGTQWQAIAIFLPGRSRNDVKNRWMHLQKRPPPAGRPPDQVVGSSNSVQTLVPSSGAPQDIPPLPPFSFDACFGPLGQNERAWELAAMAFFG